MKNLKFIIWVFGVWCLVLGNSAYAKEITLLYTGETHAMLYHCSCPKEPDGGIARRASLIKTLRKADPNTLLLDSGGFFAGGPLDDYGQNTQLDIQRTQVNLKAMELMKYDAAVIGDDEFNFGRKFLEENIGKTKLAFLSSNMQSAKALPYIIKDVSGIKAGIIGLTPAFTEVKADGIKFTEPKIAARQAIAELKKKGVSLIIILSHLGESDDASLIKDVEGIDVLISGHMIAREGPTSSKIGSTLILRPTWQGRRLGKVVLTVDNNKIIDYKAEDLRLSDKIADDSQMLSVLPRCFSDYNCQKEGASGACQNAGSPDAQCIFSEVKKIPLLVIAPKPSDCVTCDTAQLVDFLKKQFPGITVSYLYYPDAKAARLVKELGVKGLPVYLLGKEVAAAKGFDSVKERFEVKGDYYGIKPQFSGISYFINREKIKGDLDLFISLYGNNMVKLLDTIKEFNPVVHFLAVEQEAGKFDAPKGNQEVEEDLRCVCVKKYYPEIFWDYIKCRAASVNSSWWENCLTDGLDLDKVRACARGEEGKALLRENIQLNKELEIMFGPTYLMDNREAFASQGVPEREEFKKIFRK